jgi:hypothetical protein
MPFRSYKLIRLNKAIGISSDITTHSDYDVTIYDNFGRATDTVIKLGEIDREWCELRMTGDRFGKLDGGRCMPISEQEFEALALVK